MLQYHTDVHLQFDSERLPDAALQGKICHGRRHVLQRALQVMQFLTSQLQVQSLEIAAACAAGLSLFSTSNSEAFVSAVLPPVSPGSEMIPVFNALYHH